MSEATPRPVKLRLWGLRLLCSSILFVFVGVGSLELGLRLFGSRAQTARRLEAEGERARRASIWTASEDPVLIYVHRPSYSKDGVRNTERHGILRSTNVDPVKGDDVFRIVVLGDSIAAGIDLPQDQRFPDRVETLLNRNRLIPGKRVEVLNFAVNGYRTIQEARLLETQALRFGPDLILLQFCLNDPGSSLTPTIWFMPQQRPWFYFVGFITRSFNRGAPKESFYVPVYGPDYGKTDYWLSLYEPGSQSWASVVGGLKVIGDYARERDIPSLLVLFPLLLEHGWQVERVEPFHRQVKDAAVDVGFEVLDLLDIYSRLDVESLRMQEGDIYHPNARGHRLAAEAIYARLLTDMD